MSMKPMAVLALLASIAGCQAAPAEMSEAQRGEIEAAVRAAATAQNNDWEAQEDMDRYISHHSDWAFGVWPAATSLENLRVRQTSTWEQFDWETSDPVNWEVLVLAPNVAAARAVIRSTRTNADGAVAVFDRYQAEVWVLEDGQWKLLLGKDAATRIPQ